MTRPSECDANEAVVRAGYCRVDTARTRAEASLIPVVPCRFGLTLSE